MASPNQPEDTHPGPTADYPAVDDGPVNQPPRILRLRIAPWDVICTLALLGVLLYLVTSTGWTEQLFAFTDRVCLNEECPPVPYGVNYYIFPVMWGGIGAAVAAAVLGPFVSMLKGWYMSFWPIIAIGVLTLASVLGYALTGFSERYWH